VVLDHVDASGEFQWFNEQHDYAFWREAWLERIESPSLPESVVAQASTT